MRLATWNVNSINARLPLVLKWLEVAKPDVLGLEGLKCVGEKFPAEEFTKLGYNSAVFGQRTYNGVAILAREASTNIQRRFPDDDKGAHARLIAATSKGGGVVNVHMRSG